MGFEVIFQQIKALIKARCSVSCEESYAELGEKGPKQVIHDTCHYALVLRQSW